MPQATESHTQLVPAADQLATPDEAQRLFRHRREHITEIDQPLVLISQMQRSGGTLLSELFDGHPQLHAHPYELHIGHPTKYDWPVLDLDAGPEEWHEILHEEILERYFDQGYHKYARKHVAYQDENLEAHPFTLVPSFQRSLFLELASEREIRTQRDVLDLYMTSYFNAWLDNQNLHGTEKRFVIGFCPRLAWGTSRAAFLEAYPDGRQISAIRDPNGFFASARLAYPQKYGDITEAIGLWRMAAEEILAAKQERPDAVHVVAFETLLSETEATMRAACTFLGIDFDPILTRPTFNRRPIKANSSFRVSRHGILDEPICRTETLSDDERNAIEEWVGETYREVRTLASA
ncbi:MAG: sulfotransferase [Thermoleophilaceae bacterium]|nr:sulfotransferase [Thermoleophilaceae bacterium]